MKRNEGIHRHDISDEAWERKRHLRGTGILSKADTAKIQKQMLPYG
ncbi:hypothetical protein [Treponema endosymbiont of Eucomonympha sp.]|nr:hypothetical protein [Treponema endosymbiont of Eucomonympha sp.]